MASNLQMWTCNPNLTSSVIATQEGFGPLFVNTLQSILAAQCALAGDHLWPPDNTEAVLKDPNFDFIIIGAGSAGSVLANRLSEIPEWRILLVEAGGNPTLTTEIPMLFYNAMKSPVDWQYVTHPQPGNCKSYEYEGCAWPRGKVLGGSSSINGMFYCRGNKLDYDGWAASGNEGWSYDEVLPYFKKSENFSGKITKEGEIYHQIGGYMSVEDTANINDIERLVLNAGNELGMETLDFTGHSQMGIMRAYTTTNNGKRESTARAFLSPVKSRKNLVVIKNAHASEILFKTNTNIVTGVKIKKGGSFITVNTIKELILSAGAINTPQLMMISGLGPRKHLEDLNIKVRGDLHVGENLQDHLFVPIFFASPGDSNTLSLSNITDSLSEYFVNNSGMFSDTSPNKVIGFINTTDSNATSPDIQFHFLIYPPNFSNLIDVYQKHGLSYEFRKKFSEVNKDNLILNIHTVLLKPKSRGRILLNNKDPQLYPLLYANFFEDPVDLQLIIKGMKRAIEFGETKAFKDAGFKLLWVEINACKSYDKKSDDFFECIARELTFSLYHPCCSVKMGPNDDATAVVGPDLKVKNVERLRIIDGSVMPIIVSGNTNAPIIMIAEKGADIIKREWLKVDTV